ncbi:MAG: sporulation integral membrane protein YtvI [Lachnospiraceae bacterium]|jgi:sporulation integral membrane protein YtvI|nr:sporulation integral membrane protein YtvI [Lachnospiraceae bacterium]
MQGFKKYARLALGILFPLAVICAVCVLGPRLLRFFMPFVVGWVLALLANPLVQVMEKRLKILRKHGSALVIALALGLVILALYLLISWTVSLSLRLMGDLPRLYALVAGELAAAVGSLQNLFGRMPAGVQNTLIDAVQAFSSDLSGWTPSLQSAGHIARGIPTALVYTIVTVLSAYFFIAQKEQLSQMAKRYLPDGVNRYVTYLSTDVKKLLGGYFLAQLRIMSVVLVILAVGFFILKVPYWFLIALLVALLDFLPVFGTGTVLVPWALVELVTGKYALAAGFAVLYVLTMVSRQIIQPKIVGDSMGIPPLLTLLLLYVGFKWQGISGMILAVPIGILVLNLYRFGAFDTLFGNLRTLWEDIRAFAKGSGDG